MMMVVLMMVVWSWRCGDGVDDDVDGVLEDRCDGVDDDGGIDDGGGGVVMMMLMVCWRTVVMVLIVMMMVVLMMVVWSWRCGDDDNVDGVLEDRCDGVDDDGGIDDGGVVVAVWC